MLDSDQVPQADVPQRVLDLVLGLARGERPQWDPRDVAYYRQAARILALLDAENSPTAAGRALATLSPNAQLARFAVAFELSPCGKEWIEFSKARTLLEVQAATAGEFLRARARTLPETMVRRRQSSLRKWLAAAQQHHPLRRAALDETEKPEPLDLESVPVLANSESGAVIQRLCTGTRHLRVATAYLTIQGYDAVSRRLSESELRLLIGSEDAVRSIPDVLEYLLGSINRGAPTDEKQRGIRGLREELLAGTARVRLFDVRYHKRLHAKVYIFDRRAAYVTSANLTGGGLRGNIEGGYLVVVPAHIEHYRTEFDALFADGIDLLAPLLSTLESTWAFHPPVEPYLFYLRVLIELFGEVPELPDVNIKLADYQRMVVGSVLQVLRDEGSGLLISPTGTGKTIMATYTAAALFPGTVRRIFVLCPNESLAARWESEFRNFGVSCKAITHGLLQGKGKLTGSGGRAEFLRELAGSTRATDLFIVDECHAFRNPKSKGAQKLRELLAGSPERGKPKCLFLTATPMSAGLHDLNNLLSLLGPEVLGSLADIARSRRTVNVTRPFIEDYFGVQREKSRPPMLAFGSEERSFPRIRSRKAVYPFRISALVEAINRVPYVVERSAPPPAASNQILLPGVPAAPERGKETADLGPLIRLLLLRAAESSPDALSRMVDRLTETAKNAGLLSHDDFARAIAAVRALVPAPTRDAKLGFLERQLRDRAPGTKVLVFTNFIATVEYLRKHLGERLPGERIDVVTGQARGKEKKVILERFAPKAQGRKGRPRKTDIDVLIATDAIAEGENLQDAAVLINYDLHWTPLRLIQRVGRLDRPTKEYREVSVQNFLPEGTFFEDLLNLWGRLKDRSALYDQLAKTQVLEESEAAPVDVNERDHGLVRGIYEEEDYEKLLRDYLPTSSHLVHFAKARPEEMSAARNLPTGFRSAKAAAQRNTFVLLRHEGQFHCVTEKNGGTPAFESSPEHASHEALLPMIAAENGEAAPPEPLEAVTCLGALVRAWAHEKKVDAEDVEVVCSEALVPAPTAL
ncbi:MAG: DEAD/DEAH box helicase family protein [Myxococcaceae bacterium]|nr:DEAD/DEAH box helicase family protein [Myxococcaceae bacterium]